MSTVEILEMSIELVEVEECSEVEAREKSIVDACELSCGEGGWMGPSCGSDGPGSDPS